MVGVLEDEGAADHGRAQRRRAHEVGEVEQAHAVVAGSVRGLDLRIGREGVVAWLGASGADRLVLVEQSLDARGGFRLTRLGVSRIT